MFALAHAVVAIEEYAARLMEFAKLMKGAKHKFRIALRSRPNMQTVFEIAATAINCDIRQN